MTAPSEKMRLFVAADVPRSQQSAVDTSLEPLRRSLPQARWTSPASRHVTLKFLGWTEAELLPALRAKVAAVARVHRPATVTLDGLGAFPSPRRARVLWVGLIDPAGLLQRLASDLEAELEPVGFAREQRPFTPHLTLARFKAAARLPVEMPELPPSEPFEVDRVILYRSRLHPHGSRYEALESFPVGFRAH